MTTVYSTLGKQGRGYTPGRTTEESGDWLEIKKVVRSFVAMRRKQCVCSGLQWLAER